jgi:hypothetical protein
LSPHPLKVLNEFHCPLRDGPTGPHMCAFGPFLKVREVREGRGVWFGPNSALIQVRTFGVQVGVNLYSTYKRGPGEPGLSI